jgi:hypothetical protein
VGCDGRPTSRAAGNSVAGFHFGLFVPDDFNVLAVGVKGYLFFIKGGLTGFPAIPAECCCRRSNSLVHSITVLAETIRLMAAVDETIAACGGWPIG